LVDITTDAAQLQARRLLDTMIEAEQDSTPMDPGRIARRSETYAT
jgi:hypothetical protein